jgi:hypothetical protein
MHRTLLALVGLIALTSAAIAGGDYYTRELSATNAGVCKAGTLSEMIYEGGNIHGHDASVFIACRQTPTKASWLFAAAETCAGGAICSSKLVQRIPSFFGGEGNWYESKSIRFNVLKYAKGTNCHVVPMKERILIDASIESDDASAWVCDTFDIYNGIGLDENMQFSKSASKPFVLIDAGSNPPRTNNDENRGVSELAIPAGDYTLNWVSEVINPQ